MIICADDFGMADDIDCAVFELAGAGKLSAVSCAVSHPACRPDAVRRLADGTLDIDVGLHLVLTEDGRPVSPPPAPDLAPGSRFHPFRTLLRRCLLGQIDRAAVVREIGAQYDRFRDWAGRPPDFIDGHLHVQQFPVVSDALLAFVAGLPPDRPYVRNSRMPLLRICRTGANLPKNLLIGSPGAAFRRKALRQGAATNTGFAGPYNYVPGADFAREFRSFIACLPAPNDLLMVHPGTREAWRRGEFETLRDWDVSAAAHRPNRFQRAARPERTVSR